MSMDELKRAQLDFFARDEKARLKDALKAQTRPPPRPSSTTSETASTASRPSVANYVPEKRTPVLKQMYTVVELLKTRREALTAAEIQDALGVDVTHQGLQLHLAQNPRIAYDATSARFRYRPLYDVHNLEEMAAFALNRTEGMLRMDLENAYPGAADDVVTLIDNRTLTSIRNAENNAEVLFGNRMSSVHMVDPDVLQLWESVGIKEGAATQEIEQMLRSAGLQPTQVAGDEDVPLVTKQKEKKVAGKRARKIKLTNTHLTGVDYDLNEEVPEAAKKAKPIPR